MLWSAILLVCSAQLGASRALSQRWDDFAEKHSWVDIPRGWKFKFRTAAPPNHLLQLRIGLKQDGIDHEELVENLMEISDAKHTKYAQHLTKEEVEAFIAPHANSTVAVNEWLEFHGVSSMALRSNAGDWIMLRVSVGQAERSCPRGQELHSHIDVRVVAPTTNVYPHGPSGEEVVRTVRYSLPKELHSHIDVRVVAPTTYFGTLKSMRFLQRAFKHFSDEESFVPVSDATVPTSCAKICSRVEGIHIFTGFICVTYMTCHLMISPVERSRITAFHAQSFFAIREFEDGELQKFVNLAKTS
ncbi:hypothetical protein GALMADRAFT_215577 [Galerina marginata CBS 339.88]|uniref:Peptidase S53 activation domain-containing protein n=1 Tax=Galerina marginata (strain CBS 339.88) TaxID=685588 RepID=A0A067SLW6_GALM3|nr:hypothetical protein GALMADRAFT_215577 [Galerina marginata CBS 339.88]